MGQHRFSGWPGAYCLLCGAEDALEIALADGWYDPCGDSWDTEEHRLQVADANNNCPHTKEGQNPYTVYWEDGKFVEKKSLLDTSKFDEDCKSGPV